MNKIEYKDQKKSHIYEYSISFMSALVLKIKEEITKCSTSHAGAIFFHARNIKSDSYLIPYNSIILFQMNCILKGKQDFKTYGEHIG